MDHNFNLETREVTLNGQTKTAVSGSWARIFEIYNDDSSEFSGSVYLYTDNVVTNGVPQTPSAVKAKALAHHQRSSMALYTIPKDYDGYLSSYEFTCDRVDNASDINMHFALKIKKFGKVFLAKYFHNSSNQSFLDFEFIDPVRLEEKTDIKLTVLETTTNTTRANGSFSLVLFRHIK